MASAAAAAIDENARSPAAAAGPGCRSYHVAMAGGTGSAAAGVTRAARLGRRYPDGPGLRAVGGGGGGEGGRGRGRGRGEGVRGGAPER
jgi:hypothetical protein